MRITVNREKGQSEKLEGFISAMVEEDLKAFRRQVRMVTITFRDINGPRGGRDMECKLEVKLWGKGSVLSKALGFGPMDGVTCALEKALRQLREHRIPKRKHGRVARQMKRNQEAMMTA